MAATGGGGAGKAPPSVGKGQGGKTVTYNGVTVTIIPDTKRGGNHYILVLPGGKKLPAGSTLNPSKQTINLPGGDHLSFKSGKVIRNTPIPKRDKLADQKYKQVDYNTGKPIASSAPAAPKPPARSGDSNRQPTPSGAAPAPARTGDSNRQPTPPANRTREQVKELQRELNAKGANLVVDGIYGPKTAAAEKQYGGAPAATGGRAPGAAGGGGGGGGGGAASGGGGGGGAPAASGPTAPAPSSKPLSDQEVDAEVRRLFGEMAAFLSHPELGPILRQAAKEGWDNLRLAGKIQQTNYWKTTADTRRKWDIVRRLDPATAKQQVDQAMAAVTELSRASGFNHTPQQLRYFAELSIVNGWSGQQLRQYLFDRESNNAEKTGSLDTFVGQQFGYLAAFLDEPVIGDLLRQAAKEGWTQARLEVELRKTEWWQNTSDSQRKWAALNEQNPQDAEDQRQNRAAEISAMAQEFGIRLGEERLTQIAEDSMRYGWSQTQIKNAVTREYEYGGVEAAPATGTQGERQGGTFKGRGPGAIAAGQQTAAENAAVGAGGPEFGLAGQTARQIREMAGQYLVPISEQMLEKWTEQIVRGETDMEGFNGYLVEQAKSMFPGMANALDQGITVAQYADPYKQIAARELEIAPESIDLNDPRYRKMLDQRDSKGNRVAMTLSESAEYLRRLPEWQQTRGANEKAAAVTENLLRTFGAVA